MKVVFDAYWWVEGPPSLRHVLREIVLAWSALFPEDDLVLVVRRSHLDAAADDAPAGATLVPTMLWPQALSASTAVPAAARRVEADLLLTHNFAARAGGALSTVYLHDVLFATNPEWFTPVERAYFSLMLRWIRRAELVFTSSETEAMRIRSHSRARVVVPVGLGLSTELVGAGLPESPDPQVAPRRFVLTVGRLNTRKNLGGAIAAALASGRVDSERPLIVVGSADGRAAELSESARAAIASGAVRFVGFVDEARLRWYYRNASVFVYLSHGEGFGMPPVEAQYFGASVVVSDLPVFRETLHEARFVDPDDAASAGDAIASGIAEAESRDAFAPRDSVALEHNWHSTVRAIRSMAGQRLSAVAA